MSVFRNRFSICEEYRLSNLEKIIYEYKLHSLVTKEIVCVLSHVMFSNKLS